MSDLKTYQSDYRAYTLAELAWEFLRRNPGYRAAWERYKTIDAEFDTVEELDKIDMEDWLERVRSASEEASWPWGLERPVDPQLNAKEARPVWRPGDVGGAVSLFDDEVDPAPTAKDPETGMQERIPVFMKFPPIDLRKPVRPQVEAIEKAALDAQKQLRQRHPKVMRDPGRSSEQERRIPSVEQLINQLWAYDARAVGAPYRAIGAALRPDADYGTQNNLGYRYFRRAEAYVKKDYRLLLLKS